MNESSRMSTDTSRMGGSKKRKLDTEGSGSDKDEPVSESWSKTEQYKVKGRHRWTIDNFLRRASCTEVGDSLCSPVFSVQVEGPNKESQDLPFQLEVFPNGEEGEDNSDYVAVFLTSRRQEDLDVKYDFSVQKVDGTVWGRIGNTFKKFSPDQNSWGYGKAFSKAKLQEKMSELLPNNKLTIVCNLEIYYQDRQTTEKVPNSHGARIELKERELKTQSIGDDLAKAASFEPDSKFSDITLVCGNRTFACHKVILASRSDVFDAMLSHPETLEGQTSRVEITDIDEDSLEQLLSFIYTDKLDEEKLGTVAMGLLGAADKYNVPRLKAIAERAICDNLNVDNAADALHLAHLHDAKHMKRVTLDYVIKNIDKVVETKSWGDVVRGNEVLGEVLKSVMSKLRPTQ